MAIAQRSRSAIFSCLAIEQHKQKRETEEMRGEKQKTKWKKQHTAIDIGAKRKI